jgi:hypothetical protein
MEPTGICGGIFVLYYLIGLVFVFSSGKGNLITGLFLALIWPLLVMGDAA